MERNFRKAEGEEFSGRAPDAGGSAGDGCTGSREGTAGWRLSSSSGSARKDRNFDPSDNGPDLLAGISSVETSEGSAETESGEPSPRSKVSAVFPVPGDFSSSTGSSSSIRNDLNLSVKELVFLGEAGVSIVAEYPEIPGLFIFSCPGIFRKK